MENFITLDDYKARITDQRLLQLIGNDNDILEDAEATAVAIVTDFLSGKFDTDEIFSAEGEDRAKNVVRWVTNLIIYYLYERVPDRMIPPRVENTYKETMENLKSISNGDLQTALPRKTNEDETPKTKFRWGSNTAHSH